ncbi:Apoptosis-inducing factor 1 [Fusarium solani]|nr:Apoptosis-inducing factor 1 [Fusarium solani]
MKEADYGRLTRVCFIGTGMSNCHYLVRQNFPRAGDESSVHLGYSQMRVKGASYYRFVPPEILERPDKELADRLLRAYFDSVNCGWPIVDEEEFMVQYEGKDPENPLSSALMNAIFLVGAHVLSSHDESMHSLKPMFFRRAKTLIDYQFETDRLVYVQAALLMAWHSDGFEEVAISAWHWIGIGARTAMAFGMHRDATRSRMLPAHKRVYTRLWWVLFQFDTISALSSGRPQAINLDDSDVPDLEYSHFEGIPNAQKDFVIYQTKLCVIISRAMREGWALRSSPEDRVRATRKADESLAEFILQLPSKVQLRYFTLDTWQSILHLTYNNFVILLHRPLPKQSTEDVRPDQCNDPALCGDSAKTIAAIFETLPQDALSTLWLYSTNVLITATIHIIHEAGSSKPIVAARSLHILEILMAALRGLSKHWHYARAWLHFVEQRALKLKQQRAAKAVQAGGPDEDQGRENGQAATPLTGTEEMSSSRENEDRCDVEESFLDAITNGAVGTIGSTPEGGVCFDGADEYKIKDLSSLDLSPGAKKEVEVEGIENGKVLLVNVKGNIQAVGAKCTHYGAPLVKGVLTSEGRLTCPWHGACFNAKTGDVEDAPALDHLPVFQVAERNGAVYLTGEEAAVKGSRRKPNIKCAAASGAQKDKVVVVGGGSGTLGLVEGLREKGYKGPLTVISNEGYYPIDRTKLSKALMTDLSKLTWRDKSWYESGSVEFIESEVTDVNFSDRYVTTDDGKKVEYTKLVLATGGTPRRLPLQGFKVLDNIFTLRSVHDTRKIVNAIGDKGKKIVVIGSSFIGIELAVATSSDNQVTVVGMEKVPLERVLGEKVGAGLQKALEGKGVKFYMGASVDKAEPDTSNPSNVGAVYLKDGTKLDADLVVLGVGVSPATGFLQNNKSVQLEKDGSLKTDDNYAVAGLKDVYAIGDIATFPYHGPGGDGTHIRIEHWNVAQQSGRIVASHIVNPSSKPEHFIPIFWSALGAQLRYCGNTIPGFDDIVLEGDPTENKFIAYYCKGETVVAMASMGRDPAMSQSAELMRVNKMLTKTQLQEGMSVL